jgi:serine-type D-Ala-D-Ala carboxypeptidase/endopeptidase (penicillin-binding protein 4)
LLATENSQPLSKLVTTMLKDSDNTIANSLFKTIGSVYAKDSGSFQNGSEAVRDILNKSIQLEIPKQTVFDGAGGSRYNFFTPQQIVTLLEKTYLSNLAVNFIPALPISGFDGTLKARMKDTLAAGNVFAKTGSETAVSTLSGYIKTRKNHILVFSIMMNGFVDLPIKYTDLQDKLCAVMVENG